MKINELITEGLKNPKDNPCWKGYKPVGTKKKGGKTVPNCVPTNEMMDVELSTVDPEERGEEEGSFVKNQLHTIRRVVHHLEHAIGDNEDLPEWVQMKISQAQQSLVGVMDFMISDKEIDVEHDTGEEGMMSEDWQSVNKHDKTDGLSKKAVKAYRRENPGSKLKTAVTKDPSKIKKGSSDDKRRKSFCSRMSGMKKHNASAETKRDPDSPINKALRRWNCE